MQVINIFVAIIVALGFWNKSSKERDLATEKASLTKTVILLILTVATIFFYYKTYQVATFNNKIIVEGIKGSYDACPKYYDGDTIIYTISKDRISSFVLLNHYSRRRFDFSDPFYELYEHMDKSGFSVELSLDNSQNITKRYPDILPNTDTSLLDSYEHCYDVYLFNNKIPSLFPVFLYNNWTYSGDDVVSNETSKLYDNKKSGQNTQWNIDDYEILYNARASTYKKQKSTSQSVFSEHINSLNFFSAADLSQCIYQINIVSDIPIDSFLVCFDISVEVSACCHEQSRSDSRCFSVDIQENADGTISQFLNYHVKFPTLANLQLIRSLILTTLLTALVSLSLSSIYYYCRKKYVRYLQKKPVSFENRKKILLVWIPTGKTIVWTTILISAVALILSILNRPVILNAVYFNDAIFVKIINIFILLIIIMYCYIVYTFFLDIHKGSLNLKKKKNKRNFGQKIKIGLNKLKKREKKELRNKNKQTKNSKNQDNGN